VVLTNDDVTASGSDSHQLVAARHAWAVRIEFTLTHNNPTGRNELTTAKPSMSQRASVVLTSCVTRAAT
jgi:hypothetical protein